jgi:hypothetical protein
MPHWSLVQEEETPIGALGSILASSQRDFKGKTWIIKGLHR